MSWLRLEREEKPDGSVSYAFGEGKYVKRMHRQHTSELIRENCSISAWRISTRRTLDFRQNRIMYRARQCSDSDGPMLAPDVFFGRMLAPGNMPTLLQSTTVAWHVRTVRGKTAETMPPDVTTTECQINIGQSIQTLHTTLISWLMSPTTVSLGTGSRLR